MPRVLVEYLPEYMNREMSSRLKDAIRKDASIRFSTSDLRISTDDFSIIFFELSEFSAPTNPIVVRVELHNFPERLERVDTDAREMAEALSPCLAYIPIEHPLEVTIGVSLMYSVIGWGTQTCYI